MKKSSHDSHVWICEENPKGSENREKKNESRRAKRLEKAGEDEKAKVKVGELVEDVEVPDF